MWGNGCLVCVRQPSPPEILPGIPYLVNAHWIQGNVQDTLTPLPVHMHVSSELELALGCATLAIVDGILLKQRVSTATQLQVASKKAVKGTECILFA